MPVSARSSRVTIALLCAGVVLQSSTVSGQFRVNATSRIDSILVHKSLIAAYTDSSLEMDNLPSPSKSELWSSVTTYIPIVAGVFIWSLQKPKHVVEYDSEGRVDWEYDEDPNRTVPVVIIASGIVIGPSSGYFYGRCAGRGANGIMLRVITGVATVVAACAVARSGESNEWMDFSNLYDAGMVAGIGAGIVIIEAAYDLARVKSTVRGHNEKALNISISLSPKIFSDGNAPGLELRAMF
jgi:hypothetical protein